MVAPQSINLTRPDVAFAVNKACQFMAYPTDKHWQAVKFILHYLKGSLHHGLLYQPSSILDINGFSNANLASYLNDRCSTSGFYIFPSSNLISYCSSKQELVSKSSVESKYHSMVSLSVEIVLL